MKLRFQRHYATLGIEPGDGWQRARGAYKQAMRRWHPDRYPDGHAQKREAEERTKAVNQAYNELAGYYRSHGVLPLDNRDHQAAPPDNDYHPQPSAAATPSSRPTPSSVQKAHHPSRLVPWGLVALGLVGVYFLVGQTPPEAPDPNPAPQPRTERPDTSSALGTTAPTEDRHFSVGSSLGEVYSIQGIPTRIDGDTWHFGGARVYFVNGRVARWDDPTGQALKAQSSIEPSRVTPALFALGATKDQVRQIQGEPARASDRVWEYGMSRVYFENDRVTKWHESPLDPLRVHR
jgi:hypothetical protein